MNRHWLLLLIIIGVIAVGSGTALLVGEWKQKKNASKYLPLLNAAERKYGIPTDLLARMAYQESHWRDDIVNGTTTSTAGALGLMQLVPKWHPTVNPLDVPAAIDYAARYVASLHTQFGSWPLAVAAYNAGPGNVQKYAGVPPFPETQSYVADIFADVLKTVPTSQQSRYA